MKVIYDARAAAYQFTGLGRFTGDLLIELLNRNLAGNFKYVVLIYDDDDVVVDGQVNSFYSRFRHLERCGMCNIIRCGVPPVSLRHHFGFQRLVDDLEGDVYFYPHFDLPIGIKTPSIVMVHDLFPLKVAGYIVKFPRLKILYFRLMLAYIARKSKFIFALSECTRVDYLKQVGSQFSSKVGVSLAGSTIRFRSEACSLENPIESKNFLLYVGDRRPHKNLTRILRLFHLLRSSGKFSGDLVIVGNKRNHDVDIDSLIEGIEGVHVLGQVGDDELSALYYNCKSLIFLSKYEGLGLPVLEASSFGKKIIVSDGGALPEFAPPWALIVPNMSPLENEVDRVLSYLSSPLEGSNDFRTKHTWEEAACRVERVFRSITGESS